MLSTAPLFILQVKLEKGVMKYLRIQLLRFAEECNSFLSLSPREVEKVGVDLGLDVIHVTE